MAMNVDEESDYEFNSSDVSEAENDGEETSALNENNLDFDLTLPATHSYLGENLEELRGRTLLDVGIYMNLPVLVKKCIMLLPGQTLPMTVFNAQHHIIDMIKTCIANNRTLGIVCLEYGKILPIGTTAEIYEYKYNPDQGFRLKAKGRQRFKVLKAITESYDKLSANVKVLPEIRLGPPFWDQRLNSLDHLRIHPSSEEEFKQQEKVENLDAMVTPWPAWVYRQYDPYRLSAKIRKSLKFIENRRINIPEDPSDLSFWVAQNMLLDNSERITLLNYDCAIQRLQTVIKYLDDKTFVCSNCDLYIAKQSDMFPMCKEGIQGTYCNAAGIVHDTVTLYHAQGLVLSHEPSTTEYSWFPGYAWRIALCNNCGIHMGWRFTAFHRKLKPKAFWGLTRKNLKRKE